MVHRVGVPSSEHVKSDEELFAYLLKVPPIYLSICPSVCLSSFYLLQVFDMGEEEQEIILQKVQEAKVRPPIGLLHQNLSDPLWLLTVELMNID